MMPVDAANEQARGPFRFAAFVARWRWGALVLGGALFVATCTLRWRPGGDSAALLVLGRQLAETGRWANLSGYEQGVMLAYPWLLALLGRVGDPAMLVLSLQAFAFAVWVGFVFLAVRRKFDQHAALVVSLMCLCSARTLEAAADVLPGMFFAAGVAALLWCDGTVRGPWRRAVCFALVLSLLVSLRSVGLLVVGALLVAGLLRVWWPAVAPQTDPQKLSLRRLRYLIGIATVGVTLAALAVPAVQRDLRSLFRSFAERGPDGMAATVWDAFAAAVPEAILGIDPTPYGGPVLTLAAALGLVLVLRRRPMWGLIVLALAWPWFAFIAAPRYVVPVLPVIYLGLWLLAVEVHRRIQAAGGWMTLGLLVVLAGNLIGVGRLIYEQRQPRFLESFRDGRFVAAHHAAAWLRKNTPPGTRVLCTTRERTALQFWAHRAVVRDVSTPAIDAGRLILVEPAHPRVYGAFEQLGWSASDPLAAFEAAPDWPDWTLHEVLRPERESP